MRFARFGSFAALFIAAAGCQTDDGGGVTAVIPPLAFVRYVNAVPDSISLDSLTITQRTAPLVGADTVFRTTTFTTIVRWVDQLEFTPFTFANVAFKGVGQGLYQGLEAGSRHFRIFTYDTKLAVLTGPFGTTTTQLADTTVNFVAGQYYTIVYIRPTSGTGQHVRVYTDSLPAANAAAVQYRTMNLAPSLGAVDVYATALANTAISGTPDAVGVAELGRSPYRTRAAVAFAAQVTATAQLTSLAGTAAPTGVAGTTGTSGADAIAGATIGGSVLTAMAFRASPAVIFHGRTIRAAIVPSVVWVADRQPLRINP